MTSSVDDECRQVLPSSEVVPHGLLKVYVVSSNGGRDVVVADRPTVSLAMVARIRRPGADNQGLSLKGKSQLPPRPGLPSDLKHNMQYRRIFERKAVGYR